MVDVLAARVGDDGGSVAAFREILRRSDQRLAGGLRFKAQDELPSENPPAEVVDHRVQVSSGSGPTPSQE
jgi:hypothetical protein